MPRGTPVRRVMTGLAALALVGAGVVASPAPAVAQAGGDTEVSVGSPDSTFSANKQNEPAVAVDPMHPDVLVAGANDNIDMEACNAGKDNTCPFTDGVGVSGVYFSFTGGHSWTQPEYQGLTARGCTGAPGDSDPPCTPSQGPIGTLPHYDTHGLVSDGDPALAFGPVPLNGHFSWGNGSRLYYVNLTSKLPGSSAFKGYEAIGVSHTDDVQSAAAGDASAWSAPVIASKQNSVKFSDKEQVWADNAATSHFFGNVYVCYAAFRGNGGGYDNQPLSIDVSRDGGSSWAEHQVTSATNNVSSANGFGRSGCTVRTDSAGKVYAFFYQFAFDPTQAALGAIQVVTSSDGGATWSRPRTVTRAYDSCDYVEPSIGRCVMDGVGGARDDLAPAPSVDIANGAPTGSDATNRIVMSWVDGQQLNHEHVRFMTWTAQAGWSTPRDVESTGDRGYYAAPAISPNGTDVYLVYNAWTTPFRDSAVGPGNDRQLLAVVKHADVSASGVGTFAELHRSQSGDARGASQNNLAAEFLGDYVYAVATRAYGAAVWNDVRDATDCPAIDSYRQALHDAAVSSGALTAQAEEPRGESQGDTQPDAQAPAAPAVAASCPAGFGNTDIYGGGWADPTP